MRRARPGPKAYGYGVAEHPGSRRVCLVVIDETDLCSRLIYLLGSAGYQVLAFTDGQQAVAAARRTPFALAIVDVDLPGLNSSPMLDMVRRRSDRLVLLVKTRPDESDESSGVELDGDHYVVKPFSLRELATIIKALLGRLEPQGSPRESLLSPRTGT